VPSGLVKEDRESVIKVNDLTFEVYRNGQGLLLKVALPKARTAVVTVVTENDLAWLGGWFSPAPTAVYSEFEV